MHGPKNWKWVRARRREIQWFRSITDGDLPRHAHPDLAEELEILPEHAELESLDAALRHFAFRGDEGAIASMTASISHGHRLGIDVANSMREYADLVRQKRRQSADELAGKASVKLLFPMHLCMVPSVRIILWGPAVLELAEFVQNFEGASNIMPRR